MRTFPLREEIDRSRFKQWLDHQKLPIQLDAGEIQERRNVSQNARLWALHGLASEATGYTKDELHDELLCQHYGYIEQERKHPITGEITMKKVPLKRSSARNKQEFRQFLDFVENTYAENLGIWLGQEEAA